MRTIELRNIYKEPSYTWDIRCWSKNILYFSSDNTSLKYCIYKEDQVTKQRNE